ncbi:hypothetical protein [Promicromonospora soli]|uniref:Uncharacterized protein n=1 Tax=Promicromonospora soli TaxID=2035533 RepID=A0A919G0L5_9MICO|nr:hypothetical protein [Promicromonospora soli]GHH75923.1 hypothetical protein GCM10017772_33100 [Promicromonospora soli]
MLITEPWSTIADRLGIVVSAPPPDSGADIVLAGADWPMTAYRAKVFPAPIRPEGMRRHAAAARELGVSLLVIVPSASPGVSRAALDENVSLLIVPPSPGSDVTGFLFSAAGRQDLADPVTEPEPSRRPGRVPWATYALAFELLETPNVSQRTLARRIGVTQPRVSQALRDLDNAVRRTQAGWEARSPDELADWILARYPWRPRIATSWLTLDAPVTAARRVTAHLTERGIEHAVGGDVAADSVAPWARPFTAWIWAGAPIDLQETGATPTTASAANLFLAISDDPYLLKSATRAENGDSMLPAWRVWIDLVRQGHDDAALALRRHLTAQGSPP